MRLDLQGVPETLTMPLWARAAESALSNGLISDPKAEMMLRQLDYDFGKFQNDWRLQLKVAIRTMLLDRAAKAFIDKHPNAVVVNIGAGLDTRFTRVDNGKLDWMDLDLPETIALRRNFFEETARNPMIACSVFEEAWLEQVPRQQRPILFIAEGVFPYFSEARVRNLLEKLARVFPGAEMLVQTTTRHMVRRNHRDAKDKFQNAKLHWGVQTGKSLAEWQGIELVNDWIYSDYCRNRWRGWWWWTTFPPLSKYWHNRIVQIRFRAEP